MQINIRDESIPQIAEPSIIVRGGAVVYTLNFKDAITCSGFGRTRCLEKGEHSFFNHNMDSWYSGNTNNLPEGFVEE